MKFLDRLAAEMVGKEASTFFWGADTTSAAMMAVGRHHLCRRRRGGARCPGSGLCVTMLGLSDIFA
jgi:hypothetical protein